MQQYNNKLVAPFRVKVADCNYGQSRRRTRSNILINQLLITAAITRAEVKKGVALAQMQ